jgi:RNA polymerase sigma factor (sigma-70 family)
LVSLPGEAVKSPRGRSATPAVTARRGQLERLPDAELADLCAEGNQRAWEAFVRRYRRLIYAIPNRAGLDENEVEEVFHQTFARLAERITTIRERGRIRAWIVTTARRLTIDCIRGHRDSRETEVPEEVWEGFADSGESALESLERLEKQHAVRQAMQGIGPRCRRLLSMLFYHRSPEPPSYEMISEELRLPVGSIGPTRARCLRRLRDEYVRIQAD